MYIITYQFLIDENNHFFKILRKEVLQLRKNSRELKGISLGFVDNIKHYF